ncbi:hypothetical protein A2963_04160 [Candidatus Roizmanbacteria bacterium RIFCSPLOWO2_01_FULL_40_13]|nr:MAG: hypothetical protein A2963_04160 [Candidatus Roizmanbacteria bacterium RIFCSPLOWO2_01_FULL_40_13]
MGFCKDPSVRSAILLATVVPLTSSYGTFGILLFAFVEPVESQALYVPVSPAALALVWQIESAPLNEPKSLTL